MIMLTHSSERIFNPIRSTGHGSPDPKSESRIGGLRTPALPSCPWCVGRYPLGLDNTHGKISLKVRSWKPILGFPTS